MKYLNRRGDIAETAMVESICLFNNWTEIPPKFCFVVPTYMRAKLLGYALNSILSLQGLSDYEVLVSDDNPERKDDTEMLMLSTYNYPGIAYYKNSSNLGQPGNWNKCILLSRAEWIIMLQDDDMLYPDFFLTLQKAMSLYGKNVGGYFPGVLQHSFVDDTMPYRTQIGIHTRVIKLFDFLQGNVMGAGALGMTLNRDLVLKIGGVNINAGPAVDYDFYNRFARVTDFVKLYGRPLGVWRTMVNVSQKEETVFFCLKWGDIMMMDILESMKWMWLRPFYHGYMRAYDQQHFANWCREMGKDLTADSRLQSVSFTDKVIYLMFRLYFKLNRRMRSESHMII